MPTKIEWTHIPGTIGESWNFIGGCTKVSEGCENCYALRDSWRIMHNPSHPARYDGVAEKVGDKLRWTGRINLDEDALEQPLRWKKPRTVFVCSMSDFWHPAVPLEFQLKAWAVIEQCPQHTFLILTKRPEQMTMLEYVGPIPRHENVWYGVTVELDKYLWRIAELLKIWATVRFVSLEPMLGEVDIQPYLPLVRTRLWPELTEEQAAKWLNDRVWLDWVIVGFESGSGARPGHPDWARSVRHHCQGAGVPFLFKQWGEWLHESQVEAAAKEVLRDAPPWGRWYFEDAPSHRWPDGSVSYRVGRKAAGRLLDGELWDQFPRTAPAQGKETA